MTEGEALLTASAWTRLLHPELEGKLDTSGIDWVAGWPDSDIHEANWSSTRITREDYEQRYARATTSRRRGTTVTLDRTQPPTEPDILVLAVHHPLPVEVANNIGLILKGNAPEGYEAFLVGATAEQRERGVLYSYQWTRA